jgi:hypothetical protein
VTIAARTRPGIASSLLAAWTGQRQLNGGQSEMLDSGANGRRALAKTAATSWNSDVERYRSARLNMLRRLATYRVVLAPPVAPVPQPSEPNAQRFFCVHNVELPS